LINEEQLNEIKGLMHYLNENVKTLVADVQLGSPGGGVKAAIVLDRASTSEQAAGQEDRYVLDIRA